MEEKHRNNEKEVDLTLESLNGIKPAEANPFLYEKVMNRMKSKPTILHNPLLKYGFIFTVLILINVFTLIYLNSGKNSTNAIKDSNVSNQELMKNFVKEYNLTNYSFDF